MNQDVGIRHQLLQNLEALGLRDVERDAAFVGVEIEEQSAFLGMRDIAGKRPARARAIAGAGPFDLDDLGAHVRQQLAAIRRRYHLAHFNYL